MHEQAIWVYYELTPELVNGTTERADDFRYDPKVSSGSATPDDYKNSGYDRGHLCPAADMKINDNAMSETFYMTNMSPQAPYFNRGIWKNLEALVRDWSLKEEKLYIATGPVFRSNKGKIGKNEITIPGYYYKVIYDPTDTPKMIAFVLPNEKSSLPFENFVVSVDSVEYLTNIDFFPNLPDEIETKLEHQSNYKLWNKSQSNTVINPPKNNVSTEEKKVLETNKKTDESTYKLENTDNAVKSYTNSKGERIQSPTHYKTAPPGATAECNDGTYSFSKSRRGTCSGHGGVKRWL